jgi:hypothetical protein
MCEYKTDKKFNKIKTYVHTRTQTGTVDFKSISLVSSCLPGSMDGQAKYNLTFILLWNIVTHPRNIINSMFSFILSMHLGLCLMIPGIHNCNWWKVQKCHMWTNTRKLWMSGIMMPAVGLHSLQFTAHEILNTWTLLYISSTVSDNKLTLSRILQ